MLRIIIREMLNEMDRFEQETGRQFNVLYDREGTNLFEMAKEEIEPGVPRYYFNMSKDFKMTVHGGERIGQIKKVSTIDKPEFVRAMVPGKEQRVQPSAIANPKARYNTTPLGFYAYPLNEKYLKRLMKNTLPYVSEGKWCTVVEAKPGIGVLNLGNEEDASLYSNLKNFIIETGREEDTVIRDMLMSGSRWQNIFAKALLGSEDYIDDRESRSQKELNNIIKLLGQKNIRLVYDPGTGLIYNAEPDQAVFLSSGAFDVVERFPTKEIRDSLRSAYRDKGLADQSAKSEWKFLAGGFYPILKNETSVAKIRKAFSSLDLSEDSHSENPELGTIMEIFTANPNTPSNVLYKIFDVWLSYGGWRDIDYKIAANLAGHKNTDDSILKTLSYYVVRDPLARTALLALARNPNINEETIRLLLADPMLDDDNPFNIRSPDPELINAVMENPSMNLEILKSLASLNTSRYRAEFFNDIRRVWQEKSTEMGTSGSDPSTNT